MKINRGITIARQRVSRGGKNLFPRYFQCNGELSLRSTPACQASVESRRVGTSCMGTYIVPTSLTLKRLERDRRFRREKGKIKMQSVGRRRRRH